MDSIHSFFKEHPHISYEIHVTRWERDALGMVRRLAMDTGELLRIHVMGGSGTLFEAVNGVIGLPNAHLAVYPFGRNNAFLQYFGADKTHLFTSIRSQVFSSSLPMDVLRFGNNYGIAYGLVGLEAVMNKKAQESIRRKTILTDAFTYWRSAITSAITGWASAMEYIIDLDGESLDGVYTSMLIANGPCYGRNMAPAVDAHPNDGLLDIYVINDISRIGLILNRYKYLSGRYEELSGFIRHYRGRKITIGSGNYMNVCLDGQILDGHPVNIEVIPRAVDFVCPNGIDTSKLPRIYGRPDTMTN